MDQSTLIFIFISTMQCVVFGFSLLIIRRSKVSPSAVANYTVDAATKLAELEGTCNSLRLEFSEVIDRLERWSRRKEQRDKRDSKPVGDVLPTDKDLVQGELPIPAGNTQYGTSGLTPIQKLRIAKGR